eukprot:365251-Chlamydomonas_euryale.AAC.6
MAQACVAGTNALRETAWESNREAARRQARSAAGINVARPELHLGQIGAAGRSAAGINVAWPELHLGQSGAAGRRQGGERRPARAAFGTDWGCRPQAGGRTQGGERRLARAAFGTEWGGRPQAGGRTSPGQSCIVQAHALPKNAQVNCVPCTKMRYENSCCGKESATAHARHKKVWMNARGSTA